MTPESTQPSSATGHRQTEDAPRGAAPRAPRHLADGAGQQQLLMDHAADVIWTMNLEGRFTYVSPSVEKLRGFTCEEAKLQTLEQALTPASFRMAKDRLEKTISDIAAGLPFSEFRGEIEQPCKDGSTVWTEITTSELRDSTGAFTGILGVTRDITERKKSDAKIKRLTQIHAALSRSNEAIVRSTSEAELFPRICRDMVEFGGMKMAWIARFDELDGEIRSVASFGDETGYLSDLRITLDGGDPGEQGPTADAIRRDEPFWSQDFLHDSRTTALHARASIVGCAAAAALPLHHNGLPVGAFNLCASEPNAFDADMRELLLQMAANISFAIDGFAREAARQRADAALRASEERNRAITQSAYDAIVTTDSAGNIAGWNHGAQIIFGYAESEVMGQSMTLLIPPRYRERHLAGMERFRAGAAPHIIGKRVELEGLRKNGIEFPIELTLAKWQSTDGWFVTGIIGDITERKAQQTQLSLAAQVFAQGREGITITDADGNIIMANQAFTAITGYAQAEVLGKNPRVLSSGRQDSAFYAAMWDAINRTGHWEGELWNRHKNGTVYPEWLAVSAMHNALGQTTHYVGSFSDLSETKDAQSRIQWLSHFDPLTGLPNRTLLKDRTEHAISMVQRANEQLTVMLLSIDQFRTIVDTLGHLVSDDLLMKIAQRLTMGLRDQDTVARVGSREFVLVLPATAADGAAHLASEILRKLAQPYQLNGHELTLTASIGIASYPDNGSDFEGLLKSAEIAMHKAQSNGRDGFQFYSDAMYRQVLARDHMLNALRQAVALGQFELLYQPLADLQSGQISGLEALLRWQHPELGAVPPAQFIPMAEHAGLIKGIGEWVLRRACRDIRDWLDKGVKVPHVAVNVSPHQFRDAGLVAMVTHALAERQLGPEHLFLEVTEGALMDDVPHSETMLRELKDLGIKLSLDDFGTGYSSLSYLKRFPFDKVKIDQSFVRDIATSQSDHVLVNVIVSMAHGLGLKVIAEGVETEAQCEIMRASVCDEIQGYFFSRAVSAQAIEELIARDQRIPAHLLRLKKPQRTLLLVDDEPNIVASLKRLFRRDGHQILTANSGAEGLDLLAKHKVDIIVSDQRMPGMTGVEFLRIAKINYPDTIRIVLSGYTELQSVTDAINEGAVYRFLTKPWEDEQLREHIQKAFEYKELQEENRQLDIKIRTTNQELVAANRQLGEVLRKNRMQIKRDETSLAIAREALQFVPMPVLGVDEDGLIVFTNAAADGLFAPQCPLVGAALADSLPAVNAVVAGAAEGAWSAMAIDLDDYLVNWNSMGVRSPSRGKLLIFKKIGPNA